MYRSNDTKGMPGQPAWRRYASHAIIGILAASAGVLGGRATVSYPANVPIPPAGGRPQNTLAEAKIVFRDGRKPIHIQSVDGWLHLDFTGDGIPEEIIEPIVTGPNEPPREPILPGMDIRIMPYPRPSEPSGRERIL